MKAFTVIGLILSMVVGAIAQGLPGGQLLSFLPTTLEGPGCYYFNIGPANPTNALIDLVNVGHIGFEITAQSTNSATTVTVAFVTFLAADYPGWPVAASNMAPQCLQTLTLHATTNLQMTSAVFDVGAYRWMSPLYITNSSFCVSNFSLRWFVKPGF